MAPHPTPAAPVTTHPGAGVFRLLDPSLNHACAVWAEADDLDRAHRRQHEVLSAAARAGRSGRQLELGCQWGAPVARVAEGDDPGRPEVFDHRTFRLAAPVDAVLGVQVLEHLATPEDALRGEHLRIFRSFFRAVHALTAPGTWFALQTITAGRLPRRAAAVRQLHGITGQLPLWRRCGRPEEIVKACGSWWEVRELDSRHEDGVRTFREWLHRLSVNEDPVRAAAGNTRFEAWERALTGCLLAFDENFLSLDQFALRRID